MRRVYTTVYVLNNRIIGGGIFSSKAAKKKMDRYMEKEHGAQCERHGELQYSYGAVFHCGSGKITPVMER